MRYSQSFIPTLKEVPAEAQVPSHQLMIRAGYIRPVAAGVFSFLPLGYRVARNVMQIIREEMNAIGGQEFHLPGLSPTEIWEQTGRVEAMGDVLFHIKNREGLVLAPTHEEIIAYHAKQHIKSYKDLPQIWYQIQTKFRNEPRPRSGVLRGRQFIMKDSYSLDVSPEGLDVSYEKHNQAYHRIYERCGLRFFTVGASSGAMGGSASQEFMVESAHGEDTCAICEASGYAANLEVATSNIDPVGRTENDAMPEEFPTPDTKTINDLIERHGCPEERCAKSVVYIVDEKPTLILMRGNDELNESKLEAALGTNQFRPAEPEELPKYTGAHAGSIGPIGLKTSMTIIADTLLKDANGMFSGANKDGYHIKNIDLKRDAVIDAYYDLRTVQEGEPAPDGAGPLRVVNAIEVGHIFKLGVRYSTALEALFLDQNGKTHPIVMGSYGIGVERIMACFIEQNHDDYGIKWSTALAPFHISLIGVNTKKSERVRAVCEELYTAAKSLNLEVLYDDRDVSPGIKFKDADLLGMPVHIVVGDKNLADNNVEIKFRTSGERKLVALEDALGIANEFIAGGND